MGPVEPEPLPPVRSTRWAHVVELLPGDPARLLVSSRLRGRGGRERLFTQELTVREPGLRERLFAQVHKGDEIQIIIVTEFLTEGYRTLLLDFVKRGNSCCGGKV